MDFAFHLRQFDFQKILKGVLEAAALKIRLRDFIRRGGFTHIVDLLQLQAVRACLHIAGQQLSGGRIGAGCLVGRCNRRPYGALGCSSGSCRSSRSICRHRSGLHCARRCQQGGGRAKFFDLHFLTPHLFCQIVDGMFRLVLLVLGVLRRMYGTRFNIRNALPNRYFSFFA